MSTGRFRIGTLLKDRNLVTEDEVQEALAHVNGKGKLGDVLVDLGFITQAQLDEAIAHQKQLNGRSMKARNNYKRKIVMEIKSLARVTRVRSSRILRALEEET